MQSSTAGATAVGKAVSVVVANSRFPGSNTLGICAAVGALATSSDQTGKETIDAKMADSRMRLIMMNSPSTARMAYRFAAGQGS